MNIADYADESLVPIRKNEELVPSVNVSEIDFTTLCHPDICQAVVKLIGSVRLFDIGGDAITIGPSPVNKLLVRGGEIYGKDEVSQSLLITITEMISLPKKQIQYYMSSPPVICIEEDATFAEACRIFTEARIHGAPVTENGQVRGGIVTLTDIADGIADGKALSDSVTDVMTHDVVTASPTINLYEVIGRFKQENIGRLIIVKDERPVGILTQSDIIRLFPPSP